MERKPLILDTDMAGDCDDAGALALLHRLCDRGEAQLLCVTHCVSSDYGAGCIDAINRHYGRTVPVGNLKEPDLYAAERYSAKYNRHIAQTFENAYPTAKDAPDAVELLRRTLEPRTRPDVTLCCIGPLRVAARLLERCGPDFLKARVCELVVMGGQFVLLRLPWRGSEVPALYPESNIVGDLESARLVAEGWPTPLTFCGFEIGWRVITGRRLLHPFDEGNPAAVAYQRYGTDGRDSWDPATVYYAVRGEDEFLRHSPPGRVTIDGEGVTRFAPEDGGSHRILLAGTEKRALEERLDGLLMGLS